MQTLQTPTLNSRSCAALPPLTRMYTTPGQRPSTSAGEAVEPTSTLLRKALFDRRRSPVRPQSTTPRKAKNALRSTSYMDPWMPSDEEEPRPRITRSHTSRPARRRRATDLGNARPMTAVSPPASPSPGVGLKVEQQDIDKLKKENWDLKHRIALQQQHATRLRIDLEQALAELTRSKELRERNTILEKERDRLKQKLRHAEEQNAFLDSELKGLDEEVSIAMDQKDGEIRDRQLAIEEAAGIIQRLEWENHSLQETLHQRQTQPMPVAHHDSEYHNSTHGSSVATALGKALPAATAPTHDSDYFSADTSPNLSARASRRPLTRSNTQNTVEDEAKRVNTRKSAANFDRQRGLKSLTSKDSLLSKFVEDPAPKRTPVLKTLQRRASRLSGSAARVPSPARVDVTPQWSSVSRPLRELYQVGELGRQVDDLTPCKPRSLSPSTQASVSEMSRSTTSDDRSEIFSQADSVTTRASSPATIRSVDTIAGATFKGSTSSLPLGTKYHSHVATLPTPSRVALPASSPAAPVARTPVNYDMWPRKYPDWPPSASLHHRDVLYHDKNDDGASINAENSSSPSRYSEDDFSIGLGDRYVTWKSTLPRRSDTSLVTLPQRMEMAGFEDIPQEKLPESLKTKALARATTLSGVGKLSRSLQGSFHGVRGVLGRPGLEAKQ